MESPTGQANGLIDSLRGLGDSLVGTLGDRLALFSVELHEEKHRLFHVLVWISALVFCGVMAATFASVTLVYLFWESARLTVLVGLTLGYAGALVAVGCAFKRYLARQPKPFAATLEEITEDRAWIRNGR
jgi:uncharacterized membrane protein YqjE